MTPKTTKFRLVNGKRVRLYTVAEVAEMWQVNRTTIFALIANRQLEWTNVATTGRRRLIRFTPGQLARFERSRSRWGDDRMVKADSQ